MIEDSNRFGKLKVKTLEEFEKENKLKLPDDYRAFLIEHNGGSPSPATNPTPETDVQWIYGIHNGEYWASLKWHIKTLSGRIPANTLPIANDSGGNIFLLSLHPDSYGEVWFWDHENETEKNADAYLDNIIKSADSFTDFVNSLYEHVDENETEQERIIRTNDVEGLANLINTGYDIETKDEYDRTLLENASIHNRIEIVKLLIDKGARINNALILARENMEFFPDDGYEPLVKLLSAYGGW